jgi:chemotaxis protein CheC
MESRSIAPFDLDILGELGNIGSGNAATALSVMLKTEVDIGVPDVKVCDIVHIPDAFGGPEKIQTGIFVSISGFLDGYILFLLNTESIETIANIISSEHQEITSQQIIAEVANIIVGAYVGALSDMINQPLLLSPPEIAQDMVGALLDNIIARVMSAADETVLINTKLTVLSKIMSCDFVFILEDESLRKLLNCFRKEE